MAMQRFYANPATRCEYANGAIGFGPGGPMDCLGNYAKVKNCPIVINGETIHRATAYATSYADTWFSIPACTHYRGRYIGGYLTSNDYQTNDGAWHRAIEFRPYDKYKPMLAR